MSLKVDAIGAETVLFAGASVHFQFQPGHFTGWGSEGVKRKRKSYSQSGYVLFARYHQLVAREQH